MRIANGIVGLIFAPAMVFSQETTVSASDLGEVQVEARPLVEALLVGRDVSPARNLQDNPEVTVIPQGIPSGQSDISIRGSSFSGAGIMLEGLSLRNAQTEHFHANLPLPMPLFNAPTVVSGVSQTRAGEGHLVGSVSLGLRPVDTLRLLTFGGDEEDSWWVNALVQEAIAKENGVLSIGAFGGVLRANEVDNLGNDLDVDRVGGQVQWLTGDWQTDLAIGYQEKDFGATGYYGVNPNLPAREIVEDILGVLSMKSTEGATSPVHASLSFRQVDDDYQLELPSFLFRNQHTTQTFSGQVQQDLSVAKNVWLQWRLAGMLEDVESNALGDHDRTNFAVTALPRFAAGDWTFIAGVRVEDLDGDTEVLPQVRADWSLTPSWTLYAEHSQAARQPSYTELNYESPGSLGNSGLKNQTQQSNEIGVQGQAGNGTFSLAVFQRDTEDAVDWIRADADATRWTAANLGDVETWGVQAIWRQQVCASVSMKAGYTWLDKDIDEAPYSSRYFLDYAEHDALIGIDWTINSYLRVEFTQHARVQADNILRTEGGNEQFLGFVGLHGRIPAFDLVQWSLIVDNIWDDDFRPFPGQDTFTSRRISISATIDL